jgi:hypothetical protein
MIHFNKKEPRINHARKHGQIKILTNMSQTREIENQRNERVKGNIEEAYKEEADYC